MQYFENPHSNRYERFLFFKGKDKLMIIAIPWLLVQLNKQDGIKVKFVQLVNAGENKTFSKTCKKNPDFTHYL